MFMAAPPSQHLGLCPDQHRHQILMHSLQEITNSEDLTGVRRGCYHLGEAADTDEHEQRGLTATKRILQSRLDTSNTLQGHCFPSVPDGTV